MIKVYHEPNSRSLRVVWLMEELGEAFQVETVGYPPGEDFRRRTGVGTIPAIVDGDIVMSESIAILQYLTGRRIQQAVALGLTVGPTPDPSVYAEHLQFLHLGEASLTTPLALMARTRRLEPQAEASFTFALCKAMFVRSCEAVNVRLADGRPYLTGQAFTIADISVGYGLWFARRRGFDDLIPPGAMAYLGRVEARPAFQRALER